MFPVVLPPTAGFFDRPADLLDQVSGHLYGGFLAWLLIAAGIWFTVRTRGVQVRLFGQMLRAIAGSRDGDGGISSFQAFTIGLASRVGTGNIVGVALAITLGGPGAVFWMWVVAIVGMATGFIEATLAQMYKIRHPEGTFRGGPAYYISRGLGSRRWAGVFAVVITFVFGFAYEATQANAISGVMQGTFDVPPAWTAVILILLTAPVVFGGITVVARIAEWMAPIMAGLYALLAIVVLLLVVSLLTGKYSIFSRSDGGEMFLNVRVPRTIALILAGAAMSMSGLVMQLITQNRFVEPTTTGTTEWAGLGLLLVMAIAPRASVLVRMVGAVVMAFVGTMVFFLFLRRVSLRSSLLVPIVGIMLGSVVSALSTFFALKTNMLQSLGVWFQGSFTSVYRGQYEVLWLVLLVAAAVFHYADRLTAAGLGQDVATSIGVDYRRTVLVGTGLIALATGTVTVVVGSLPFLGLIVPNLVSMRRGDDLRSNLPWVCLVGIGLVTVCDLLARTIISPFEIPVSVVLGIVGAAVFVVLIIRRLGRPS